MTPNAFGTPGLALKSSISSLSRKPAPSTTTPLPKLRFSVVVVDTALPWWSTIE